MSTEPDPSAAASDPLIIDVEATPVPPAPRPVRTGRFSADDLAPPAPAPRMTGKLRPEDFAAIADPAPTRPADFEAVDIAGMKAKMETQRRAKLRPDSVFAGAAKAAPAASPAPTAPSSTRPGASANSRAGKAGWPPLRRQTGDGPSDADTIIDVTARVIDSGNDGDRARRAPPQANTAGTAPHAGSAASSARAPSASASPSPAGASARHAAAPASPPFRAGHAAASAPPRTTAEMHPHRHRDRVDRSAPDSVPWPISEDSSTVPPPRRSAPAAASAHSLHPPSGRGAGGAGLPPPPPPPSSTGAAAFEPEAERKRKAGSATDNPADNVHNTATASAATGAREPLATSDATAAAPPHTASGTASPRRRVPAAAQGSAPPLARPSGAPSFPPGLLKQCALALLSAGGGTFLLTMGWSFFGAWGVLPLVWGMQALVAVLAERFERRGKFMTANWLATLAIVCTPLSVFYAQHALGWWPPLQGLPPNTYGSGIIEIDWRRVSMDGLTTLFAWRMFMRHRHPVMLVPVTLALWYTLVEVGSYVLTARGLDLRFLAEVTAVYGLGAVLTSARIRALGRAMPADTARRAGERPEHYAFWLEAIGALMLWAALWSYGPTTQLGRAAHLAAQLGLLGLGWRLRRHLLSALGVFGLALHAAAFATGELSPLVLLEPVLAPVLGPVAGWMASWRH